MSQSVKLSDGSYIDAGAVWDNTQGKTQEAFNADLGSVTVGSQKEFTVSAKKTWTYDTDNAITLQKGTYLVTFMARTNTLNYIDVGLGEGTAHGLPLQNHGTIGKSPTDGAYRAYTFTIPVVVANTLLLTAGAYTSGTENPTIQYVIICTKLK